MNPAKSALSRVRSRVAGRDIPGALTDSVRQHCERLETIAERLRGLGMDHAQIDQHIISIFEEYERELVAAIDEIEGGGDQTRDAQP